MLPDDTILSAIQRARPEVPFACEAGVCSTCRAKVTDGTVETVGEMTTDDVMELQSGLE